MTTPMQPELAFDPVEHRYCWQGEPLPGVTEMIVGLGLVEGLRFFTPGSAERGDNAHKTTLYHDEDRLDWDTLPEEMGGYLSGWISFCGEHKFEPIYCEMPLGNKWEWFAGTIDRYGLMRGKNTLVDIKTMKQPCARQKPHWAIQLALYTRLLSEVDANSAPQRLNVILCPDGRYRIPKRCMTDEEADACADAVLRLHKLKGK